MSRELDFKDDMMIVSETCPKGLINYANEDFIKLSEYNKEELNGQPHSILRHYDMPKAAFKDLWETVKAGNTWNGIVKNKTKNGNYYWVNATVYNSKDHEGNDRLISVRVKPTQKEVLDAQELYKKLKQNER